MTRIAVARQRTGGEVMTDDARWFVGIDWASETHQVCLVDAGGKIVGERGFSHAGAGLAGMCIRLLVTTRAAPTVIAVAIEVPHGPIVETLLERGFLVYAINPKQLDRFRDRFTVAGAKDDRRDAHGIACVCLVVNIQSRGGGCVGGDVGEGAAARRSRSSPLSTGILLLRLGVACNQALVLALLE
jgi:hypothetical protein